MERVQKILSNSGFCSRRKAENLIKAGKVKVNDKTIVIGALADTKDKIEVDGKPITQDKKVYIILNKPINCVTALRDQKYPTVIDYVKIDERVFPVGRLDLNTSGLLLLTNDGDFANDVAHPSSEIDKTYLVKLSGKITNDQIKTLETGITLDYGKTRPARVKKIKHSVIQVTIHEGKNRIIRRMMRKIGFHVTALERVSIGRLELRSLKVGKWRHLKEYEKKKVFEAIGHSTHTKAAKPIKPRLDEEGNLIRIKSTISKDERLKRRYETKSTKVRGFKRSPKVGDGKKPKDLIFPHKDRRSDNARRLKKEREIFREDEDKPVHKRRQIKNPAPVRKSRSSSSKPFQKGADYNSSDKPTRRSSYRKDNDKPSFKKRSDSRPSGSSSFKRDGDYSSRDSKPSSRRSNDTTKRSSYRKDNDKPSFKKRSDSRPSGNSSFKKEGSYSKRSSDKPYQKRESKPFQRDGDYSSSSRDFKPRRSNSSSDRPSAKRRDGKRSKQSNRSEGLSGLKNKIKRKTYGSSNRSDSKGPSKSFGAFQKTDKAKRISRNKKKEYKLNPSK